VTGTSKCHRCKDTFYGRSELNKQGTEGIFKVAKKKMVVIGETLAKQGYCRISLRKNIVARIDVENWAEVLAQHFDKTLHEMFTSIDENPGLYEDLFRRDWSKDRLEVSLTTARTVSSSFQCSVGYEDKQANDFDSELVKAIE
jgi:hypothetical protein